jgi:hypothetical protein
MAYQGSISSPSYQQLSQDINFALQDLGCDDKSVKLMTTESPSSEA